MSSGPVTLLTPSEVQQLAGRRVDVLHIDLSTEEDRNSQRSIELLEHAGYRWLTPLRPQFDDAKGVVSVDLVNRTVVFNPAHSTLMELRVALTLQVARAMALAEVEAGGTA